MAVASLARLPLALSTRAWLSAAASLIGEEHAAPPGPRVHPGDGRRSRPGDGWRSGSRVRRSGLDRGRGPSVGPMNSLWASRRVGATAASVPLAALAIAACGGGSDTPSATEGRERSAKILTAAYHVLDRGVPYHELGEEFFYRRDTENAERYRRRLVRQLESLGHQFTLQPLPEAA